MLRKKMFGLAAPRTIEMVLSNIRQIPRRVFRSFLRGINSASHRTGIARAASLLALSIAYSGCTSLDAMRRVEVDFAHVAEIARDLSQSEYRAPPPFPKRLEELDYDQYRKIRYDADQYLWKNEGLPFSLGFFHPGFLHQDRVVVNEFTPTHVQRVRYLKEFFAFEDPALAESMPADMDYAGLRIAFSRDDERADFREIVSFLGASYFRGTAWDMNYGTSARGVAVDAGLGRPEEFPRFREVWLGSFQFYFGISNEDHQRKNIVCPMLAHARCSSC